MPSDKNHWIQILYPPLPLDGTFCELVKDVTFMGVTVSRQVSERWKRLGTEMEGSVQGQVGWSLEQTDPVEGVPVHSRRIGTG